MGPGWLCESPKEFIPLLLPIFEAPAYEWKDQAVLRAATFIFSKGEESKYAAQLERALREIVYSKGSDK
jgi:hypothetical protein